MGWLVLLGVLTGSSRDGQGGNVLFLLSSCLMVPGYVKGQESCPYMLFVLRTASHDVDAIPRMEPWLQEVNHVLFELLWRLHVGKLYTT